MSTFVAPTWDCCVNRSNCQDLKDNLLKQASCDQQIKAFCKKPDNRYSDQCACLRRPPRDVLSNLSHCFDSACKSSKALKLGFMLRGSCPSAVDCVQKVFLVGTGAEGEKAAVVDNVSTEQVCGDAEANDPSIKRAAGENNKPTPNTTANNAPTPGKNKSSDKSTTMSPLGWVFLAIAVLCFGGVVVAIFNKDMDIMIWSVILGAIFGVAAISQIRK
jgi:hypothetical protein